MAKLKTNKAAKKRYSLTATGKIKRTKSNRRHLLANKTKRQKKSGKVQNAYASKTCENTRPYCPDRSGHHGAGRPGYRRHR